MGRKNKRKKGSLRDKEEVIIIDMPEDDTEESEPTIPEKTGTKVGDDCIDLTDPTEETAGSGDNSDEVLLVEDQSSGDTSKRKISGTKTKKRVRDDEQGSFSRSMEREANMDERQSQRRKHERAGRHRQAERSRSASQSDKQMGSQRKRKRTRSRDRHNARSRSPIIERKMKTKDDRNDNIGENHVVDLEEQSVSDRLEEARTANDGGELETGDTASANLPVAYKISDGILLTLSHPSRYILKGKAAIQPLVGSVKILGHILRDSAGKAYDVYSPECHSLITLETVTGSRNRDHIMRTVRHIAKEGTLHYLKRKLKRDSSDTVVLKISELFPSLVGIVRTLPSCRELFNIEGNADSAVNRALSSVGLELVQNTSVPYLEVTDEMRDAIDDWIEALSHSSKVPACMMVVGGKDSGKSTTNRLLINTSLNSVKCVYFLEFDVGQTEFTPPGCVSLHAVTEPVIGPPFSHQRKPVCSYFFGGLSPRDDPNVYLECVHQCVQHYRQLSRPGPLIVNTMGWMKGLGLQLLVDTLRLVSPSHVIQLWCQQKHHNCEPVNEYFHLQPSWHDVSKENYNWEVSDLDQSSGLQHKLSIINSVAKSLDLTEMAVRLRANDYRDLSLMTHLCGNLDPSVTLTSQTPFVVPWRSIAIHVCNMSLPWEQIMYSINAKLVALCHTDLQQAERPREDSPMFFRSMPLCEWIGFGLVRGVDPVKKEIYIVTSVDSSSLRHVNTFIKGPVTVPDIVFIKQNCHGNRLYVDDSIQSLGSAMLKPRRHMPRTRLQNSIPT